MSPENLRRRVYVLLGPQITAGLTTAVRHGGPGSFLVEGVLVVVIAVNFASLNLWTVPDPRANYDFWFHAVAYLAVAVLMVEHLVRHEWRSRRTRPFPVGCSGGDTRARKLALIDAALLTPSAAAALQLLFAGGGPILQFLLAIRLLIPRGEAGALFSGGRRLALVLRQKGSQLLATRYGLLLVLVIAASLMYFAETNARPGKYASIPPVMWWSVVTVTSSPYTRRSFPGRVYRRPGYRTVRLARWHT